MRIVGAQLNRFLQCFNCFGPIVGSVKGDTKSVHDTGILGIQANRLLCVQDGFGGMRILPVQIWSHGPKPGDCVESDLVLRIDCDRGSEFSGRLICLPLTLQCVAEQQVSDCVLGIDFDCRPVFRDRIFELITRWLKMACNRMVLCSTPFGIFGLITERDFIFVGGCRTRFAWVDSGLKMSIGAMDELL